MKCLNCDKEMIKGSVSFMTIQGFGQIIIHQGGLSWKQVMQYNFLIKQITNSTCFSNNQHTNYLCLQQPKVDFTTLQNHKKVLKYLENKVKR